MPVNLNDWLGNHAWVWWLLVVVLILSTRLIWAHRYSLGLALGAAAAMIPGYLRTWDFWLQMGVALAVGIGACVVLDWAARHRKPAH